MLQIITGKFFVTNNLHVTRQRSVLHTNYYYRHGEPIITSIGTVSPVSTKSNISTIVYEVDEKLEAVRPDGSREFLLAVGIDSFIEDFADVMSFALNITCSPDIELVQRLTQNEHPSAGIPRVPAQYVGRVFDEEVSWAVTDAGSLQIFVENLVGLERKNYKSIMRAIRRYVHGLHRVADDLALAYSLLVASIESLAQDFDDFVPTWEDYAQNKRQELDKILVKVSPDTRDEIHSAILKHEHLALGRRFREFTLRHLRASFFREEALLEEQPVRYRDLQLTLETAYKLRSQYVHSLRELPRILTTVSFLSDVTFIEHRPILTFHGLARIARHVIQSVIESLPKVEHEVFDYRSDLPNIVHMSLADQYWIWNHEAYNQNTAMAYLNGFLRQVTSRQLGGIDPITDIRATVSKIEKIVPGLAKPKQRLPLLTLYYVFNVSVGEDYCLKNWEVFFKKYESYFDTPTPESLLVHLICGIAPDWTLEDHERTYQEYFKQRYSKNGLQYGIYFEARITLALIERYRQCGREEDVRRLVKDLVENTPKNERLVEFERNLSFPMEEIDWKFLLYLPVNNDTSEDNVSE